MIRCVNEGKFLVCECEVTPDLHHFYGGQTSWTYTKKTNEITSKANSITHIATAQSIAQGSLFVAILDQKYSETTSLKKLRKRFSVISVTIQLQGEKH